MKKSDLLDKPYLDLLIKKWGMVKLEMVSQYSRTAIYQWKPSRVPVPAEAALRISEFAEPLGFMVERIRPDLAWHLLYAGRDRRADGTTGLKEGTGAIVKDIGITTIAKTAACSRQNVYQAIKADKCPVWLALACEQASGRRYLVEDLRPELPWWPLYKRREQVYPVRPRSTL